MKRAPMPAMLSCMKCAIIPGRKLFLQYARMPNSIRIRR